jgi:hypothetical protein
MVFAHGDPYDATFLSSLNPHADRSPTLPIGELQRKIARGVAVAFERRWSRKGLELEGRTVVQSPPVFAPDLNEAFVRLGTVVKRLQ